MMIIISGRVRVLADKLPQAIDAAAAMARQSRAEEGCDAYDFGIDVEDGSVVRIFEQWATPEALEAHFATSHFADFGAVIVDVLDGEATFTRYEVSDAGPLFG
jgi:quinol monooxygenase YgiN